MGWYYENGGCKQSVVRHLTEGCTREDEQATLTKRCLAHCYRGGRFRGVLWSVWELERSTKEGKEIQRWIGCDVMEYSRHHEGWGYKPLDEMMEPFYYSCPLGYLKMVPIEKFGGCQGWRDEVVAYHNRKKVSI